MIRTLFMSVVALLFAATAAPSFAHEDDFYPGALSRYHSQQERWQFQRNFDGLDDEAHGDEWDHGRYGGTDEEFDDDCIDSQHDDGTSEHRTQPIYSI